MRIRQNHAALIALRCNDTSVKASSKNITRLSSGHRVNASSDDAAGLAISEKMRAQIRGLNQASRNVQDGISLIQTADGALQSIHDIIQRMRELAVQAASDTNQILVDREALNTEYQELKKEIDDIVNNTTFNGVKPLAGQNMEYPVDTLWNDAALSSPSVSVNLAAYSGPASSTGTTTPPNVSGVTASLSTVPPVTSAAGTVNVSASVGTVSGVQDLFIGDVANIGTINYPNTVGSSLNISGGDYHIDAADISGATSINVDAGAKLVINGSLSHNIIITGGGEVLIDGGSADVTVDSGIHMQITGNVTGNVTSSGILKIGGNVSGDVTNNGTMIIDGTAVNVHNNGGGIMVTGAVTSLTNASGAYAELKNAAGAAISNAGNMELSGSTAATVINTNTGSILIGSGTGVDIQTNAGHIDCRAQNAIVTANAGQLLLDGSNSEIFSNTGTVVVTSSSTGAVIHGNNGNMLVSGANAAITDNNGNMRVSGSGANITNNSSNMLVTGYNASILNNNGDMEVGGSGATITNNSSKMLISGTLATIGDNTGDVLISGTYAAVTDNHGSVLITGTNATVANNRGDMQVNGASATIVNNQSNMLVSGNNARITDNNGDMQVSGASAVITKNSSNMLVTGTGARIADNSGNMVINGSGAVVTENKGNLYANIALEVITNYNQALLEAHNVIIGSNEGDMIINGNSARIASNSERLQINGSSSAVTTNSSTGHLTVVNGDDTTLTINYGKASVSGNNVTVTTNDSTGDLNIDGNYANISANSGIAYVNGSNATVRDNSGDLSVNGDSAAVTILVTGQARINSNSADVINSGEVHVVGNNLRLTNNSYSTAKVEGTGTTVRSNGTGGRIDIDGSGSTVNSNYGSIEINGNNTVINANSGGVRLQTDNNASVYGNLGRIEVSSASTITRLVNNLGTILVEDGGRIADANGVNNGLIEVSQAAEITIRSNNDIVISKGKSTIAENTGYLEVGEWIDDDVTPAGGSTTGEAYVANNLGGIIRNFSSKLRVDVNTSGPLQDGTTGGCICMTIMGQGSIGGGLIENYGTMNDNCENKAGANTNGLLGEIHHHARQVDVSGVIVESTSVIEYTANGKILTQTGEWENLPSGIGRQVVFDVTTRDNGVVVFDAGKKYEVPGTDYDVQERLDVYGSSGTSGAKLLYLVTAPFTLQSGADKDDDTAVNLKAVSTSLLAALGDCCTNCMCSLHTTSIGLNETATCAISNCTDAINDISAYRAELGAVQNRLEFKYNNLLITAENLTASESRIRDADMAKEMTEFTRNQILIQSSTTMLAQANVLPQSVLQLLQ